ncbi:MAG: DUF177 domain-containing protein [Rhodospirillales bacterium]|nr:DUF177 domain-containing protein [Rhodospirillales bacterium]
MTSELLIPEFSRPVSPDTLTNQDNLFKIEASPEEKSALAKRFDLLSLEVLRATIHVFPPEEGPLIRLKGDYTAEVTQSCVVTLEPVKSRLEGTFERLYDLEVGEENFPADEDIILGPGDEVSVDPLVGGILDLGEVVAEQLGLDLNPFPRAEKATFDGFSTLSGSSLPPRLKDNPFAALEELKGKFKL